MSLTVRMSADNPWAHGCRVFRDEDGTARLTIRPSLVAPRRPDDQWHVTQAGDTLDSIAFALLGDPGRDWIVWDYALVDGHRMIFPLEDLVPGMVLRAPSKQYCESKIIPVTKRMGV